MIYQPIFNRWLDINDIENLVTISTDKKMYQNYSFTIKILIFSLLGKITQ